MQTCFLFGSILALFACSPGVFAQRESLDLAAGWKFSRQVEAPDAKTDGWAQVTVPHTWNAEDGQTRKYYRGEGWYALPLEIPKEWKRKRVFVRFDGAALVSETYLNGKSLGEHRGGFTAFTYELTPNLRFDGTDELRVRVDNSITNDVAPLSGDFNIFGGIYRPVHLFATDSVNISPLHFASSGVYLRIKSLSDRRAEVEAETLVSNGSDAKETVTVVTTVKDEAGKMVAEEKQSVHIPASETQPVKTTLTIANPRRWDGRRDPHLYTVRVNIIRNGKVIDSVEEPLGLRTVEISEEKGFLLNGEPAPVYGVNLHQDSGDKGWALSPEDHALDMRLMEEMGVTAIRLAHYPHARDIYAMGDRNGMLLWGEIPLVNYMDPSPEFLANAKQQLTEMIYQRFNHPSAVFWGVFNELFHTKRVENDSEFYPVFIRELKELAHELDPARLVVAAANSRGKPVNSIPDHLCVNAYPGWYGSDAMESRINGWYKEFGGRRVAVSEYGAGGNPTHHQEGELSRPKHNGQYHPEEWMSWVHELAWRDIQDNPKLWGSFIWLMFDFPSSERNEGGIEGLNNKGLVTKDRLVRKDPYYFYKANWNPEPMVHIVSRRMTPRKQAETEVKVYSNAPEVELKVNGKSLGKVKPDEIRIARWPGVTLKQGENRIEALAEFKGKTLVDSCLWTLEEDAPANP